MFDVANPDYDDACFFGDTEQIVQHGRDAGAMFSARLAIDPRVSLGVTALALGVCLSGTGALAAMGAVAALVLSIALRPRGEARHDRFGAFTAVELGFMIWSSGLRAALRYGAGLRASAAFGVFLLASAATLGAGMLGEPRQVILAGAIALGALVALRVALGALVRGDAA